MAEFKINGHMKVKTLQAQFKEAFGATLRVYNGKRFADEEATLASIRDDEGAKGGELTCGGNLLVNNFEAKMKEIYGITVQVASADNSKLVANDITLAAAGKE